MSGMEGESESTDAATPLLEVRGMGKRFPGVRALHDVDLTLGRGEVLAVIGENGAGKSTLMKILAGVQLPDEGEIRMEGEVVVIETAEELESLVQKEEILFDHRWAAHVDSLAPSSTTGWNELATA